MPEVRMVTALADRWSGGPVRQSTRDRIKAKRLRTPTDRKAPERTGQTKSNDGTKIHQRQRKRAGCGEDASRSDCLPPWRMVRGLQCKDSRHGSARLDALTSQGPQRETVAFRPCRMRAQPPESSWTRAVPRPEKRRVASRLFLLVPSPTSISTPLATTTRRLTHLSPPPFLSSLFPHPS